MTERFARSYRSIAARASANTSVVSGPVEKEPRFDKLEFHPDESALSVADKICARVKHFARHCGQGKLGNCHGRRRGDNRVGFPTKLWLHTKVAAGRTLDDGMGEYPAEL